MPWPFSDCAVARGSAVARSWIVKKNSRRVQATFWSGDPAVAPELWRITAFKGGQNTKTIRQHVEPETSQIHPLLTFRGKGAMKFLQTCQSMVFFGGWPPFGILLLSWIRWFIMVTIIYGHGVTTVMNGTVVNRSIPWIGYNIPSVS